MSDISYETMPGRAEYVESVDGLRFSSRAKDRMAARLAESVLTGQSVRNAGTRPAPATILALPKRRLSLAAAAAGLAAVLGLGGVAYAAGGFAYVPTLVSHLFGGGEANMDIVNEVVRPVGVSASSAGVTVTADTVIGDRSNVAIVFTLTKNNGSPFDVEPLDDGLLPMSCSEHLNVDVELAGWGASGSSYFYDEDPDDNSIQLVEILSFEGYGGEISLVGRTCEAHFSDLTLYDNEEPVTTVEGSWDLAFPLDYEDTTMSLAAGQTFDLNGCEARIDELAISPIGLHIAYTADKSTYAGDFELEWIETFIGQEGEESAGYADVMLHLPVTVTMADGSSFEEDGFGGGAYDEAPDGLVTCEKGILWDRILDLGEVASITVGGTTIEL